MHRGDDGASPSRCGGGSGRRPSEELENAVEFGVGVVEMGGEPDVTAAGAVGAEGGDDAGLGEVGVEGRGCRPGNG